MSVPCTPPRGLSLPEAEVLDGGLPDSEDLKLSHSLSEYLHHEGLIETPENLEARRHCVRVLEEICSNWVKSVASAKLAAFSAELERDGRNETLKGRLEGLDAPDGGGCKLCTFGSFRLGVHAPDSDVDVLCVAPRHVTREDFFGSFVALLVHHADVTEVLSVPEAYTPVIKFRLGGVAVDLLFVSLWRSRIPPDFSPLAPDALAHLDEPGVRSLNGARNAEMILALVPKLDSFQAALRALKYWARVRGIYGNVYGFLGGINVAILVAFVQQRFPEAAPSKIVIKFFEIFRIWRWPNPVMLTDLADSPTFGAELLAAASPGTRQAAAVAQAAQHVVWNPKVNPQDRAHLMPIITPAYPAMNSAYNVGEAQRTRVAAEVKRGIQIIRKFLRPSNGKKEDGTQKTALEENGEDLSPTKLWEALLAPADFFQRYEHYLQVRISAGSPESLKPWLAWCESKLRYLVVACTSPPTFCAHPYANLLDEQPCANGCATSMFIGLTFQRGTTSVDLTPAIRDFIQKVNGWGRRSADQDLMLLHLKSKELPEYCFTKAPRHLVSDGITSPVEPASQSSTEVGDTLRVVLEEGSKGETAGLGESEETGSVEKDSAPAERSANTDGDSDVGKQVEEAQPETVRKSAVPKADSQPQAEAKPQPSQGSQAAVDESENRNTGQVASKTNNSKEPLKGNGEAMPTPQNTNQLRPAAAQARTKPYSYADILKKGRKRR